MFLREIPFLNFWGWVGSIAWILTLTFGCFVGRHDGVVTHAWTRAVLQYPVTAGIR